MNRQKIKKIFFLLLLLIITTAKAQQNQDIDTTKFMKPPKNPNLAAIMSGILPGAGQIYNEKYWKVPIIYGLLGGSAYVFYEANYTYKMYLHDLWLLQKMNDGDTVQNYSLLLTGITNEDLLKSKKNFYRRYRDLSIFAFFGIWGLNVLDAYVDAHLSNFDVSDDLAFSLTPYIYIYNQQPFFGAKITLYLTKTKQKL